jgi:hypothetical protein
LFPDWQTARNQEFHQVHLSLSPESQTGYLLSADIPSVDTSTYKVSPGKVAGGLVSSAPSTRGRVNVPRLSNSSVVGLVAEVTLVAEAEEGTSGEVVVGRCLDGTGRYGERRSKHACNEGNGGEGEEHGMKMDWVVG